MNKSSAVLSDKNGLYPRNYRILTEVKIVYGFKILYILSDMPIIFPEEKDSHSRGISNLPVGIHYCTPRDTENRHIYARERNIFIVKLSWN